MKLIIIVGIVLGIIAMYLITSYQRFRNTINAKKYNHVPNTVDRVSVFPFYAEIYTRSATNTTEESKTVFLGIF